MAKGTHELKITIGNNLRSIRINAGKTQEELGDFLGISFQQIQKYERALNRISADYMYLMASFLGVNIMDFYNGLDQIQENKDDKELLKVFKQLRKIKNRKVINKIMNIALVLEEVGSE